MKDTFNLLADGIVKLIRALASVEQSGVKEWGKARGYEGYLGSSLSVIQSTPKTPVLVGCGTGR